MQAISNNSFFHLADQLSGPSFEVTDGFIQAVSTLINAIDIAILITDDRQHIKFANKTFLTLLDLESPALLQGFRPSEVFHCPQENEGRAGCERSILCSKYDMLNAIIAFEGGHTCSTEVNLIHHSAKGAKSVQLRVRAMPIELLGYYFIVFTCTDIRHEKRRRLLERMFFHDILNLAGSLRGFVQLLQIPAMADKHKTYAGLIEDVSNELIDEIEFQRDLLHAENQTLKLDMTSFDAKDIIERVQAFYQAHQIAAGKCLQIDPQSEPVVVKTDAKILMRVLGNLVKNALEAVAQGETVSVGCRQDADQVCFWVHNDGYIDESVQSRIFKNTFSTKGQNRGIGTYSVKLFAERYLYGHVSFSSTPQTGTRFWVTIPIAI